MPGPRASRRIPGAGGTPAIPDAPGEIRPPCAPPDSEPRTVGRAITEFLSHRGDFSLYSGDAGFPKPPRQNMLRRTLMEVDTSSVRSWPDEAWRATNGGWPPR